MINRHEGEGRIHDRVHHANVQVVNSDDWLPVRQGSASKRIDSQLESGPPNRVHIDDVP